MADTQTKFLLTEDRIPTHWVNLLPDLPGDPLPPLNPQTKQPAGPQDLAAIFPMALIEQEVSSAPEAAVPRAAPGAGAGDAGAHLLQVRGRLAGRVAQAQHRRAAGLRERARRRAQAHDRDRGRPVGLGARVRLH